MVKFVWGDEGGNLAAEVRQLATDSNKVYLRGITPAEREELKRCLDSFVEVIRKRLIDGRPEAPNAKTVTERDPAGEDGRN